MAMAGSKRHLQVAADTITDVEASPLPLEKIPRINCEGSDDCLSSELSFLDSSDSNTQSHVSMDTSLDSLFSVSSSSMSSSYDEAESSFSEEDELEQPLYVGVQLTALQSCICMMQYKFRHSLSKKAFVELIDLNRSSSTPRRPDEQINENHQETYRQNVWGCGCAKTPLLWMVREVAWR